MREQLSSYLSRVVRLGTLLLAAGCAKSDVPVGDAAANIRNLVLNYVQYASSHEGVGPKDQAELAKYVLEKGELTKEQIDALFVSPRDNQPYVIAWGERPMGSGPMGPNPPPPTILIVEKTGADATRYVADGRMSVNELSLEACQTALPESMR